MAVMGGGEIVEVGKLGWVMEMHERGIDPNVWV